MLAGASKLGGPKGLGSRRAIRAAANRDRSLELPGDSGEPPRPGLPEPKAILDDAEDVLHGRACRNLLGLVGHMPSVTDASVNTFFTI